MENPKITRVVISQGTDGDYYTTAFSSNGRAIFRSSEGYRNYTDALGAAKVSWPDAQYVNPNGEEAK